MTGGYITYQIIKCQYHIALLGTNIWKSEQISNIKYIQISSNIKYYSLQKKCPNPGKGPRDGTEPPHGLTGSLDKGSLKGTHRDCYAPEMRWFLICKKNNTRTHFFYMCFTCVLPVCLTQKRVQIGPRICADRPRPPGATVQSWGAKGHQPFIQKKGYDSNNQLSIKIENL
jgi:hypothetical protein